MIAQLNREAWLEQAVAELRPIFLGHGYTVPELRVSVGWPSSGGLATKKKTIGQCWYGTMASDGKPQLFISPLLDDPKSEQGVLATLVHEVVHTVAGPDAKHGPKFKKVMDKVGLTGKPTATVAGEDLLARLAQLADKLGPFPHARIVPNTVRKPQTTRMRKCECSQCGFLVRLTQKWADVGTPICPLPGHGPMNLEMPEGEDPEDGE